MPITHFEILKLPNSNKVISTINGIALLENTLYPISEQSNLLFERIPSLDGIFLEEKIEYRVIDQNENIKSNSAFIDLVWKSNNNIIPTSQNKTITINNSERIELIQHVFFNVVTEFIEITDISDNFILLKNGTKVSIGDIIYVSDLLFTSFTSLEEGGGNPYFKISYKAGNKKETSQTIYSLQINVNSLAELKEEFPFNEINYNDEFDVNGILTTYNVIEQTFYCVINKGYVNGTAEIEIIINSPFLSINQWNKVVVETNNSVIEKTSNETFNLSLKLDVKGKTKFKITNYIVENTDFYSSSNITVNLLNINNDASLVSTTKQLSLLRVSQFLAHYPLLSNSIEVIRTTLGIDGTATDIVFDGTKATFNGTTSKIMLPDNDIFSFTDGNGNDLPFSIEFDVYLTSIDPTNGVWFVDKREDSVKSEWQVIYYQGDLNFILLSPKTAQENYIGIIHTFTFPLNQWVNVRAINEGGNIVAGLKLEINGSLVSTTPITGGTYVGMVNDTNRVTIGDRGWDNGKATLNGSMKNLIFKL